MSKKDLETKAKQVKAVGKLASIASDSIAKAAPVVSEAFINDAYQKQKARENTDETQKTRENTDKTQKTRENTDKTQKVKKNKIGSKIPGFSKKE